MSVQKNVPSDKKKQKVNMKTTKADLSKKGSTAKRNKPILQSEGAKRKQAEAVLEEERNLLYTLMGNLPDAIYFKDAESRFIRINQAQARRFSLTDPAQAVGKTDFDFFAEEHARPAYEDEQAIIRSGQPLVGKEEKETWPDGRAGWVSTTKMPLRDQEGRIIGTFGISRDITERKQAEDALAEERNLLHVVIDNLPDRVFVKDVESRILLDNIAHQRVLGATTQEEVVGKTDFDFFSQGLAASYYADEQKILHSGTPLINREELTVNSDGSQRWLLTTKLPLRDLRGTVTGIVGISHDITERKQSEKALMEERDLLHALMDNLPDGIYFKDTKSHFTRINQAQARRFGISDPAQAVGKTDFDFFSEDHARPAYGDEQAVMQSGQPLVGKEEKETWPDGRVGWVSTTKMPLRDQEGQIVGTFGISRDITKQKQAEEAVLREKQYFEALFRNSPVAVSVLDSQGKIVSTNPAFEQLYGYKSDELIGVKLDTLVATPETVEEAASYTRQSMAGSLHAIGKRRRRDGSLVDVEIFGAPVAVGGETVGTVAIYHDISEIMRAREEAEQANRAKSQFLANMSHEIRTPMNGVIGMLELALDTTLTSEQSDYVQTALQSAEALLALLNDILDFSKIEAGKLELEKIDFDLRNTVEDVAYTLAKRAQDKGLEMACLIHPDLSSDLRGDPGRIRQILVNLVGNAIKFTDQGEIVVRAEPTEQTQTYAVVHFSVQDTGIGIPIERQAAIFDRFTQADGSTTRKYGGTGLGLTISKQLVEAMGGKIGVQSTPGAGSIFWFEVKFEKQAREKKATAPLTLGPVNLTQARILVVDDNQTNRTILTKNVEALGSRVDAVASGAKGLESLRNAVRAGDPYHVVLLDMQMPGMDGEQTARAIKSDPAMHHVKIIVLTSMGQRGDAVRLEALGCSGYLLKPVKQQMLFDAIVAALSRENEAKPGLITRHVLAEQRKTGLRLLLAEDNAINQKLAVVLLQKAGYSVDAVETGVQALEKFKTSQYSAVLMDVQMPEMDGFESTHRIREWEQESRGHIPIIAMTAHAMQGDRERCLEAGMDDYVSKPLEPKVLFNTLDRWLQISSLSGKEASKESTQDYSSDAGLHSAVMEDGLFGEMQFPASEPGKSTPVVEAMSSADTLPVNFDAALYRFGDDRNFMMEMFKEYKDHLSQRVIEIRTALKEGDANHLGRLAHNLKGVSLNFSADPIAKVSLGLEELSKREDLTDAPELVEQLEKEVRRLEEYYDTGNFS